MDQERALTDSQRDEFEDMLRALTLERSQIQEAMGFALDNSEAAGEVCCNSIYLTFWCVVLDWSCSLLVISLGKCWLVILLNINWVFLAEKGSNGSFVCGSNQQTVLHNWHGVWIELWYGFTSWIL
jgi:hypothetical protein